MQRSTELHVAPTASLHLDGGEVDWSTRTIRGPDGESRLTVQEAKLLEYLVDHAGEVLPHKQLLTDVWGYSARVESRTLYSTVNRLRKKIERDPSQPRHLEAVPGTGYRFVLDSRGEGPDARLPAPVAPFVGRDEEIREILDRLEEARLLTVRGPGGIGKTSVVRQVALHLHDEQRASVAVCDLSAVTDLGQLVRAVARDTGISLEGDDGQPDVDRLGARVAERGVDVLILDNFEQVVELAPRTVGRWLELAPTLRLLVTSRERLRLRGEVVIDLPPLSDDDAAELFRLRAEACDPSWSPQDLEDEILERLEGLPLAIELAAALVDVLPPSALAARLASPLEVLDAARVQGPDHLATMSGAIRGSWDLLGPREQRLLAWCAVFRGGFDLEALEGVCGAESWTALKALRDKSLVRTTTSPVTREHRFSLFETVRQFASARLEALGEAPAAEAAHRAWFLRWGEALSDRLVTFEVRPDDLPRLEEDLANLLLAHRSAVRHAPAEALRLARVLGEVFLRHPAPALQRQVLDDTVAAAASTEQQVEARLLRGRALWIRSAHAEAEDDLRAGLALAEEAGLEPLAVDTLTLLALVHLARYRLHEAHEVATDAVRRAAALGDELRRCRALHDLARIEVQADRYDEAGLHGAEALEGLRRLGDASSWALALLTEGQRRWWLGDAEAATRCLDDALAVFRRSGQARHEALTLCHTALTRLDAGELPRARADAMAAQKLLRDLGDGRLAAWLEGVLGQIAVERERYAAAEQRYARLLQTFDQLGSPRLVCFSRVYLGRLYRLTGRLDEAEEQLRLAAEAEAEGDALPGLLACAELAVVRADRGDLVAADAWMTRAADLEQTRGVDVLGLLRAHLDLARWQQGEADGLARALRRREQVFEPSGDRPAPIAISADVRVCLRALDARLRALDVTL